MNNWTAIAYIALGFGFVFFLTAIYVGFRIELSLMLREGVMLPWFVLAALSWVVAFVGKVAGLEER